MSFSKDDLEWIWFKHSWNIRKHNEWSIVTDKVRIRYFDTSWICETTELSLIPTYRQYRPETLEQLKNIVEQLT